MSILKVARLGHPVLRRQADLVDPEEIRHPLFQKLLYDMIDTMREYSGVGSAAPQIHVSKQIFICEVTANPRYPEAPEVPLTIVINPVLREKSEKHETLWEGCLSVPDLRGVVERHESLVCEGLDRHANPIRLKVSGFFARIIQHEWDHLQGSVYLDRMKDLRSLTHLEEFTRFHLEPE